MRFVDINGDKEEHYEEISEYARQRQENERRLLEEKQVREWFAAELDNQGFLRVGATDLIKYVGQKASFLKKYLHSVETYIDKNLNVEQLWNDFFLYNLNLFTEYFISEEKRKTFIPAFAEKIFHIERETALDFISNYQENNRKYTKYLVQSFSLEKNTERQLWRLICQAGDSSRTENFMKEYMKFIYFYVLYLYLSVPTENDFNLCKRALKQYRISLLELIKNQRNGKIQQPELKKLENPLYCISQMRCLQTIQYCMKVILFSLDKKSNDEEGEFEMIEELYRQMQEQTLVFEDLNSIIPEEIRQDVAGGRLPEFQDYDASIIQENEKVHYLDHTVLYQGQEWDDEIQFRNYKGILLFTDKRIIFKGKQTLELDYEKIGRVTEYDVAPEILEVRSGNKINYFQLPDVEMAYKILKLIANCQKGEAVAERQVPLSYEELLDKADIKAYRFAFEYMASGDLPMELRQMLTELNHKLDGLQKTIEKNPQREEEIYQFLHYYIPEAVSLVRAYQSYQGTGLSDDMVKKVYEKVVTAVQALDKAVYQKILDIYQTSARDTMAGADALREILGQDGYVDSSYTINR